MKVSKQIMPYNSVKTYLKTVHYNNQTHLFIKLSIKFPVSASSSLATPSAAPRTHIHS